MKLKRFMATALMMSVALSMAACGKEDRDAQSDQELLSAESLMEAEKMPDKLPDGMEWYEYKEKNGILDHINDKGLSFSNLCTDEKNNYILAVNFSETMEMTNYLIKTDKDWNVVSEEKLDDSVGYPLSLESSGDELLIEYYDDSDEQFLYTADKETLRPDTSEKIRVGSCIGYSLLGDNVAKVDLDDHLIVTDKSGNSILTDMDLRKEFQDYHIYCFSYMMAISDHEHIVRGETSANNEVNIDVYFYINTESGEKIDLNKEDFVPDDIVGFSKVGDDVLAINDNGIYKIDFADKSNELKMSFNCTNCNRYILRNSYIIDERDGAFTFMYLKEFTLTAYGQPDILIYDLEPTSEYAQSGRNVVSVASVEPLSYEIAQAIYLYNENSSTDYMVFDDRYIADIDEYTLFFLDADERATYLSDAYNRSVDKLIVDIGAGDGPDLVIMNGLDSALSDDRYLTDLNGKLKLDDKDYFMNAVDACQIEGSLYQVPIDFTAEGIIGRKDYIGDMTGITLDEYASFVQGPCNGIDPAYDHILNFSRSKVAVDLFANMHDLFIKNGEIDVNNDSFKAILDYCKTLPTQSITVDYDSPEEYLTFCMEADTVPVRFGTVNSYGNFTSSIENNGDITLCGYPSADGRSAIARAGHTCSVTTNASDIDACIKFFDILLSGEIQDLTTDDRTPVRRSSMRYLASFINEEAKEYSEVFGYSLKYDDSLIDQYEDFLSGATTSYVSDEAINLIIYEEIPAYLEGQKSFEDVAKIINDRATTVLQERQ